MMGVSRYGELNILQTVGPLVRLHEFLRLRSIPELQFFWQKFSSLSNSKLVIWTWHERENDDFVIWNYSIPFASLLSVSRCNSNMISHCTPRKSCNMFNSYVHELSRTHERKSHGRIECKNFEKLNANSHGGDEHA